jgi:light-regulated signal transduction histidine kinase (bacteriophytochrome)
MNGDQSELESRFRELERSNKALEQFAAIASHDLSAPLRTIHGFLRLLEHRHGPALPDEAREFVAHAVHAASRMQRLIDDLLVYSRVGQADRPPAPVDTGTVMSEVADALGAREHVTWDELPTITGYDSELEQLFQNLIGNALKFVPPDHSARVRVTAEPDDGGWKFTVDDNGIGIDPETAESLFDAFQRGVAGEEYDGTGVGLAIARKVVEHHGGRIWVAAKDGEGARFCFTLPG